MVRELFSALLAEGPAYRTELGMAFLADSTEFIKKIPDNSVNLVMTSPPFALQRQKKYGNLGDQPQDRYVSYFVSALADEIKRILTPDGSVVIDIGGGYKPGLPVRSLYHFKLAIELEEQGFHLAQEFYWYNPAKMPAPIQWVNKERIRVKDSVNPVWWFSLSTHPKADNRKVLKPYSEQMRRLLKRGTYNEGPRDSEHVVGKKWATDNQGAIPDNVILALEEELRGGEETLEPKNLVVISNTSSNDVYSRRCREMGIRKHPARFPLELPAFFIKFLTDEGDVVFDPFGGSGSTGRAAENLRRRWITSEIDPDYVAASRLRFFES